MIGFGGEGINDRQHEDHAAQIGDVIEFAVADRAFPGNEPRQFQQYGHEHGVQQKVALPAP